MIQNVKQSMITWCEKDIKCGFTLSCWLPTNPFRKCTYLAANSKTVALSVLSDIPGTSFLRTSQASLILALEINNHYNKLSCLKFKCLFKRRDITHWNN